MAARSTLHSRRQWLRQTSGLTASVFAASSVAATRNTWGDDPPSGGEDPEVTKPKTAAPSKRIADPDASGNDAGPPGNGANPAGTPEAMPKRIGGEATGDVAGDPAADGQAGVKSNRPQISNHAVFTKPLTSMPAKQMAAQLASMGFGGVECPVRPGGRIDPQNAADELPAYVETIGQQGLQLKIITTSITRADDPITQSLLRTAATLGIRHYRMGYYKYQRGRDILSQLAEWKAMLKDLAALNHDFGIQGLYQNHAGENYMGAAIWDLHTCVADLPRSDLGVIYDLRHAVVEGGKSWPIAWRLISEHVGGLYAKDFKWENNRVKNVPLGTGLATSKFWKTLPKAFAGLPISLHEEYLDHRNPWLVPQHLAAIDRDYVTLRTWL
ncbi:MAG: TIM barrel protein [Planctomycetota bacterium]